MRHRAKSSKIKYEHKMIHGLRELLETHIEPLEFVTSIIPGEIRKRKGTSSTLKLKFQYGTKTGAKLLAYSSGAVQEVFVVCKDANALLEHIKNIS